MNTLRKHVGSSRTLAGVAVLDRREDAGEREGDEEDDTLGAEASTQMKSP